MTSLMKRVIKESFLILLLCTIGGVIAGLVLHNMEDELIKVPGILILLPAILGMRGNVSGALGSRLASALHLGLIKPELKGSKILYENYLAAMILNVVMSFLLGIIAYSAYVLAGFKEPISIIQLTLIALIAGTLAGIIMTIFTVLLAIFTYAKGLDPDNVLMPSLSTVGDIITVFCLLLAVKLII